MYLDKYLNCIGIRILGDGAESACDIERAIIEIVLEIPSDNRLYGLLFSWLKVHGNYVIVEKLKKLSEKIKLNESQIAWLSALAVYGKVNCSHKWKLLIKDLNKPTYLIPEEISKIPIKMHGAIDYLEDYKLLLPKSSLRIREQDILSPRDLIKINRQYRNRYLFGPSWRADIITALEEGVDTPTKIAKKIGCSYEPAYRVFHEYRLVQTSH